MPFKTLLSVIGVDQSDRDLQTAIGLCQEIGAHLSVLVVALAAPPPIGEYAAVVSDAWLEEREADMNRLRETATKMTARLADTDVSADVDSTYSEIAWANDVIGRRARYADLTVLGPDLLTGADLRNAALSGALFESAKPVLIVPEGRVPTLRPKRVLVAWGSRPEAVRAVREALDLLAAAEDVRVVLVDPQASDLGNGPEPGADIATYLTRHGVKVSVDRLPSSGQSVATVLKQHATDMDADLIVMGGYGHSRLRERIFGGVTRSMLDEPVLPMLMAR